MTRCSMMGDEGERATPEQLRAAHQAQRKEVLDRRKRERPRTAPPLPRVQNGQALTRSRKNEPAELRDLDAAFRGQMFQVLGKPEVLARIERLLTSAKDAVVISALKAILPTVLVQRKEGDGGSNRPIIVAVGVPRSESAVTVDVTPHA